MCAAYWNVSSFGDPFCDGFSRETNPLNIHGVTVLWLALGREVHEHGSSIHVQLEKLCMLTQLTS